MDNNNYRNSYPVPSPAWYRKKWGRIVILFLLVFLILIILASLLFSSLFKQSKKDQLATLGEEIFQEETKSPERLLAEKAEAPFWGNQQAGLVIVEFADFQCPYCRDEFPIIREVSLKYKNDILYIYRQFPVFENSLLLSQSTLCANEQGKFWQLHDKFFLYKWQEVTGDVIKNLARQAGLDLQKFDECIKSEKYREAVLQDASDAQKLGVSGTPTFFINGHLLAGVITKEQWEKIIGEYKRLTEKTVD
ncbi:MAG: thioredoxin domain-containing protein [Patescibacteria group bacterium]